MDRRTEAGSQDIQGGERRGGADQWTAITWKWSAGLTILLYLVRLTIPGGWFI